MFQSYNDYNLTHSRINVCLNVVSNSISNLKFTKPRKLSVYCIYFIRHKFLKLIVRLEDQNILKLVDNSLSITDRLNSEGVVLIADHLTRLHGEVRHAEGTSLTTSSSLWDSKELR